MLRRWQSAVVGVTLSLHKCAVYGTPSTPAYTAAQQTAPGLEVTGRRMPVPIHVPSNEMARTAPFKPEVLV
jgi:hypothetical protein